MLNYKKLHCIYQKNLKTDQRQKNYFYRICFTVNLNNISHLHFACLACFPKLFQQFSLNPDPHVYLHFAQLFLSSSCLFFFLRLPLNPVPRWFWVISHMLVDLDVFCIQVLWWAGQRVVTGSRRVTEGSRLALALTSLWDKRWPIECCVSQSEVEGQGLCASRLIFLPTITQCLSKRHRSVYVRTAWDLPDPSENASLEGCGPGIP